MLRTPAKSVATIAVAVLILISASTTASPQQNTRIITPPLPQKPCEKTVELVWRENNMTCRDSITLKITPDKLTRQSNARLRVSIQRKCDSTYKNTPIPIKARFTIKHTKRANNEISKEITPESSAYSINHSFRYTGTYRVAVINYYSELETHTLSLNCDVH